MVRAAPPRAQGLIRLVVIPPDGPEPLPTEAAEAPLSQHRIGLREFRPAEKLLTLLFGDVPDQVAYERAFLTVHREFLMKSPDGGVWRMTIERRVGARGIAPKGGFGIEAKYELGEVVELSAPRRA